MQAPKWCIGIASIIFDIDVGQRLNSIAPGPHVLSEHAASECAYHAFPVEACSFVLR
jgi:hypothetical protein